MIGSLLKKVFGTKNQRELSRLAPIVGRINELEPRIQALSDVELAQQTTRFKERLTNGESLEDLLPEAFGVVREASRRTIGLRHFDVQLMGGIVLHEGKIAEMKTGEGKTLVATLPLYLNALLGRGVHLVTVNDYLAKRDAEWMGPIYKFLGLSVGVIVHGMSDKERKDAYACDITYGTNNEFGFDYLRDNMKYSNEDLVQREFYYAIVDEVDSILIDEARTPLIISGPVESSDNQQYLQVKPLIIQLQKKQRSIINELIREVKTRLNGRELEEDLLVKLVQIKRGDPKHPVFLQLLADNQWLKKEIDRLEAVYSAQKLLPEVDQILYCTIDERGNVVELTEKGIKFLSSGNLGDFVIPDLDYESQLIASDENLSEEEKPEKIRELQERFQRTSELLHAVHQMIKAYWLFEKDVHYVVKDGKVIIVDEFTGRLMPGRRWSDGLHQAVEAKEGVKVGEENQTLATITFQNFFRMYEKLAGMTGTADTEAAEFKNIYNLDVVVIPTHKKMIRVDHPDVIYRTEREKYKAVVEEIKACYERGQPVLVGTVSIEKSELLSKMLKRQGIPHSVLNAKHHEKEAEIIARAGQLKTVTISTNMAGRGTDIVLGEGVRELGGLHVIGTERHESRRIDNQLRGRSGRQGDPGSSRFYLSLEDDLLRIFGSERISGIMSKLGMKEGEPIYHPLISKAIENAQKKVEAHNFEIRKRLLEYDDVMNKHREVIYSLRRQILLQKGISDTFLEMMRERIEGLLESHLPEKLDPRDWNLKALLSDYIRIFGIGGPLGRKRLSEDDLKGLSEQEIRERLISDAELKYFEKAKLIGEERFERLLQFFMLQIIDHYWVRHLESMEALREGIGLRGYAQQDPLREYKKEGFVLFEELMQSIKEEIVQTVFRLEVQEKRPEPKRRPRELILSHEGAKVETMKRAEKKVGRNDPCPCGSGKKYKKCCGA
ncbi:MAG: preprotein translocase subunit SecA [Desulfatiglandales bacterium]